MGIVSSPTLFFIFNIVLMILGLKHLYINLRASLWYLQNKLLRFSLGLHWICRLSRKELTSWWYYLLIHEHETSLLFNSVFLSLEFLIFPHTCFVHTSINLYLVLHFGGCQCKLYLFFISFFFLTDKFLFLINLFILIGC